MKAGKEEKESPVREEMEKENEEEEEEEKGFRLAGRSNYLRIDLDAVSHNVQVLRSLCSPQTEIMAVVKANATGHGSVAIARHLVEQGVVNHFATATAAEGRELRQAGIRCYIQVFGTSLEDLNMLAKFRLTPTVSCLKFLRQWATEHLQQGLPVAPVVLKIDTGMSRHGCQPDELPKIIEECERLGIPIHSLMTHFAVAWEDADFTQNQMNLFMATVQPYRERGMKLQAANVPAIIKGFGTELDFVRPGISMYGLPPDASEQAVGSVEELGLRPALCWIARPTLVKTLPPGRSVGYGLTYTLRTKETIATFNMGYADGYSRRLSGQGIFTTAAGEEHPVVGRISMDAVTVKINGSPPDLPTPFYVYSGVHSLPNSVTSVSRQLGTIPADICAALSSRLPRVYVTEGKMYTNDQTLPGDDDEAVTYLR